MKGLSYPAGETPVMLAGKMPVLLFIDVLGRTAGMAQAILPQVRQSTEMEDRCSVTLPVTQTGPA